ncbi:MULTISPECIES: HpsJ-like protein, cyanoexosortase A-associated [unclassified Nostoc]|nr:HpsJ family protein [Nostoc sp. S13]MDF5735883.1 HpsJ family protein [Nostoc sp. S13]
MNNLDKDYWPSIFNLRFIGYILLILSSIDVVNIFIPFQFTNPVWEFQMIGALVEHAPLPLIGSMLVFFGEINYRREVEIYLLNFISWAALLAGILFLLLLPLGINNTWRIDNQNRVQITNHSSQQITQMQQIKKVLSKATTNQDINQIIKSLNRQENTPELKNPQEVKSQLLSQIWQLEKNTNNQAQVVQNNTHKELIRNSLKWNLGALICSFAFISIWRVTHWAR